MGLGCLDSFCWFYQVAFFQVVLFVRLQIVIDRRLFLWRDNVMRGIFLRRFKLIFWQSFANLFCNDSVFLSKVIFHWWILVSIVCVFARLKNLFLIFHWRVVPFALINFDLLEYLFLEHLTTIWRIAPMFYHLHWRLILLMVIRSWSKMLRLHWTELVIFWHEVLVASLLLIFMSVVLGIELSLLLFILLHFVIVLAESVLFFLLRFSFLSLMIEFLAQLTKIIHDW